MNRAFIWDLDGTLLDSYTVIVASLAELCGEFGLRIPESEIHDQVITDSVTAFLRGAADAAGTAFEKMKARYSAVSAQRVLQIRLMDHAAQTLERLRQLGAVQYVFTHRGRTTETVLNHLGIGQYFEEVVTSLNAFPRKPAPDGIRYLVDRYGLDRGRTAYVGDRTIDMECARCAGVEGILYLPPGSRCRANGAETRIVQDLLEIPEICSGMHTGK